MSHKIYLKAHLTGKAAEFMQKHTGEKVFKKVLGNLSEKKTNKPDKEK